MTFASNVPYIGVTGFTAHYQVETMLNRVPYDYPHFVMVGVLASSKTLNGLKNHLPNRYPAVDKIADIFDGHLRALNLIHFASRNRHELREELDQLTELGGEHLHGFQLNMLWPDPGALEAYRRNHEDKTIVLQLNRESLEWLYDDSENVVSLMGRYDGLVDRVLFDPSAGLGIDIDADSIEKYVVTLRKALPEIGVGIAGGLSAESVPALGAFFDRRWPISIDAESKLRNRQDELDLLKVHDYLSRAFELFDR